MFSFLWFLFSSILFYFIVKMDFFKNNKKILKSIWLIFLYISSLAWIVYLFKNEINYFVLLILLYSTAFNFKIHLKYQNYISLFFTVLPGVFIIYYLYFQYFYVWYQKEETFITFSLFISLMFVLFTYFKTLKYSFDYYFFHIIWYLINIISIVYFFYVNGFDIFNFWVILLFDSFYVFLSVYKLNKTP